MVLQAVYFFHWSVLGSVVVLFLVVLAGVSCVHRGGRGGASPCVLALVVQAGFHVRGVVGGVLHVIQFVEGNVRRSIIKTFEQNLNSAHKAGLLSATPLLTKKIFFIDGVFSKYIDKTSQFLYLF